jgi:hypothetical protein
MEVIWLILLAGYPALSVLVQFIFAFWNIWQMWTVCLTNQLPCSLLGSQFVMLLYYSVIQGHEDFAMELGFRAFKFS